MRIVRSIKLYADSYGIVPGLVTAAKLAVHKRLPVARSHEAHVLIPRSRRSAVLRPRSADVHAFWQVFVAREYDIPIEFQPRLIVDAGAHVGFASIYFAERFPRARLVAIEPDPENARLLALNLGKETRATVLRAALWPERRQLRILDPAAASWSFRVMADGGAGGVVETVTMQDILACHGDIDILKLDIEGAENELLAGDVAWLRRVRMVIIELHERYAPGCTTLTHRVMREQGFKLTLVRGENLVFEGGSQP